MDRRAACALIVCECSDHLSAAGVPRGRRLTQCHRDRQYGVRLVHVARMWRGCGESRGHPPPSMVAVGVAARQTSICPSATHCAVYITRDVYQRSPRSAASAPLWSEAVNQSGAQRCGSALLRQRVVHPGCFTAQGAVEEPGGELTGTPLLHLGRSAHSRHSTASSRTQVRRPRARTDRREAPPFS